MAPKLQQVPRYTFRVSKTHSNIRVRECQYCKDRTRQKQAQDWAGKWVEVFLCLSCLNETK
jgi:hypothetical protein